MIVARVLAWMVLFLVAIPTNLVVTVLMLWAIMFDTLFWLTDMLLTLVEGDGSFVPTHWHLNRCIRSVYLVPRLKFD